MENGKGTSREMELLGAAAVAGMIRVKETTVYRWCKEGKLPCLKVGKHWRIRRGVLEDFLKESERPRTLSERLDSFLRVPDNVLAIAQNTDILHRLDAAFFRVGEGRAFGQVLRRRGVLRRGVALGARGKRPGGLSPEAGG